VLTGVFERLGRQGFGALAYMLTRCVLGSREPVVCLHSVPASAFLYRKLLPELAARALRGIAFDFPGLGLAERPARFDYAWSGLSAFLKIMRGFELTAAFEERIIAALEQRLLRRRHAR